MSEEPAMRYPVPIVPEQQGVHLNLENTQLVVDYANIDVVSNDDYIMIRRNGFGGSDASVLVGVNPFNTLEDLIKEKASTTISAEERAIGEKSAVKKGRDLEPLIIDKFTRFYGANVLKPSDMYRFTQFPYLKVNYDGVVDDPAYHYIPMEIKVITLKGEKHYNFAKEIFNERDGFRPLPENIADRHDPIEFKAAYYGIPAYYYTQIQQEMAGLNAPFGYLSVLKESDWSYHSFLVYFDQITWDAICLQGYKAWEKVEVLKNGKALGRG